MTNLQTWIRHAAAIGSDEFSASNQVNLRPEHKANSTRLFNTVIVSMQVSTTGAWDTADNLFICLNFFLIQTEWSSNTQTGRCLPTQINHLLKPTRVQMKTDIPYNLQ